MPNGWWEQQSRTARPRTALLLQSVWASDEQAAVKLACAERDRLLDIFAVIRGRGRPADRDRG